MDDTLELRKMSNNLLNKTVLGVYQKFFGNPFLNEKNFKDYSVLDARLKKVLGLTATNLKYKNAEEYTSHSIEKSEDESFIKSKLEENKTRTVKTEPEEEEDDDLAYFSNLLDD